MIKRIELINFMSHRHTVIEPAAGLTVLVGPNNCGKSAVVTALQILCHNDTSTYVLRHGAKECRVVVETEEGHRIEWIRKKNGSPSYLIDGQEFDRLRNDSGVWDELKRTLKMPRLEFDNNNKFDVHIGEQRNPIFLLGDKGRGAAQFFASSSDAIRLVEMQALHKKQVSDNKSERKWLAKQQTDISESLECLDKVPELAKQLQECESQYDVLKSEELTSTRLSRLLEELKQKRYDAKKFGAIEETLDALPEPPEFENPGNLEDLVGQIRSQRTQIDECEKKRVALESLGTPPTFEDESSLERSLKAIRTQRMMVAHLSQTRKAFSGISEPPKLKDADSVSELAKFLVNYQTEIETCAELKKQLSTADRDLKKAEKEIASWVNENPNCPTCGSEISAEVMIGNGGHQHG